MTYVISDVHGNYERWADIRNKINLTDDDRLIVLGDVIDRGPDGIRILQEIMGAANVTMMMGNHELMMLNSLSFTEEELNDPDNMDFFRNWTHNNGGLVTYEAFLSLPDNEQRDILEYLSKLPSRLHIEVNGRKFTLVHGFTNNEGSAEADVWSRPEGIHCPGNLTDGSLLIVGHTPVVSLMDEEDVEDAGRSHFRILHADNYIDIDCCCAYPKIRGSALGCIRLDDMSEYYSVCESNKVCCQHTRTGRKYYMMKNF